MGNEADFGSIRVVLFDAVGTLIRPAPPVAEVYHRAGLRHGSQLDKEQIAQRFRSAFARHNDGGATDEARERQRWQSIVADVFEDVANARDGLFAALWRHFADSRHWSLLDDVRPAWQALRRRGLSIGIASNFDQRLEAICREIEPLKQADCVFYSSQIGFPKPRLEFFRRVEQQLALAPHQILLIGDDRENDGEGARRAGWHSLLVDPQRLDGMSLTRVLDTL